MKTRQIVKLKKSQKLVERKKLNLNDNKRQNDNEWNAKWIVMQLWLFLDWTYRDSRVVETTAPSLK
jgi:hypothetical protein